VTGARIGLIGRRQPLAQPHQQIERGRAIGADEPKKRVAVHLLGDDSGGGAHRGAAWPAFENAHFADKLAFADAAESDELVLDLFQNLDLALDDPHHVVAVVALGKQDVAFAVTHLGHVSLARSPPRLSGAESSLME
jgi:hypothetical protein